MAVQIDEAFQHLAALQATEDLAERGPQVRGIENIQDVPHLRSQGTRLIPEMVRKLSLGLWRRWSKASGDGSLSENMAKADIKASAKGISTSPDRGSEREAKRERRDPKRASAERSFRASPGASAMASHSIGSGGKIGNSGKHYA